MTIEANWTTLSLENPGVYGEEYLILYRPFDASAPLVYEFQIKEWEHYSVTDWDDPTSGYVPFIEGSIKWDGCSNWMQADKGCMLHFCGGLEGMKALQRAFERCFELAERLMPE